MKRDVKQQIVINEVLGIDENDVNNENDLTVLLGWINSVDGQLGISNAHIKKVQRSRIEGEYIDADWFARVIFHRAMLVKFKSIILMRRGKLKNLVGNFKQESNDQILIGYFKKYYPDEFFTVLEMSRDEFM